MDCILDSIGLQLIPNVKLVARSVKKEKSIINSIVMNLPNQI